MKPLKDYSHIKGFNYTIPGLFGGFNYSKENVERDMGYAKKLGLNSARIFMSIMAYQEDPQEYIKSVKHFVQTAWSNGISSNPILLVGPYFTEGQQPYWLAPDHSDAPIPGGYYEQNYHIGEEYCAAMIEALKDEPGLLMWDVMNEPSWHGFLLSVDDKEEKQRRYDMVWKFVRHFTKFVREKDPVNAIGIGHTFIEDTELSRTGDMVDVIIFHDYLETRSRVEATCRRAIELSKKYNKPVVNNETGCLCRSNPYDMAIEIHDKYKIGWYLFELMITPGMWEKVHGICYPDGTVRDPSIVAAIGGFFRNRGESAVYPDVNQEGHADKAIAMAKKALDERKGADELLEAAEYMANLLEAGELVPMAYPPTAKIMSMRAAEKKNMAEIRAYVYSLIEYIKKACEIA